MTEREPTTDTPTADMNPLSVIGLVRTAIAGVLMGIANLIPGVSGGTMILAVGLYEEFIDAVADVTALRIRVRRVVFLLVLFVFGGAAIFLLSKAILYLLLWHNAVMFALFIGLTLGGAPLLARMIGRASVGVVVATIAGFAVMAGIAMIREGAAMPRNTAMDVVSGVVGSMTMVLPGISGSYMLLILDQYDRIIGAVDDLRTGSMDAIRVLIPVGVGVAIGIVGLSNLLKLLLHRFEKVTLGFLLGMLLGSALGLWPFDRTPTEKILSKTDEAGLREFVRQFGIADPGDRKGTQLIEHIREHWSTKTREKYSLPRIVAVLTAAVAGFVITTLLGRLGARKPGRGGSLPPETRSERAPPG